MSQLKIGTAAIFLQKGCSKGILVNPTHRRMVLVNQATEITLLSHGDIVLHSNDDHLPINTVQHLVVWVGAYPLIMLEKDSMGGYRYKTNLHPAHLLQNSVIGHFIHYCNTQLFADGSNPNAIARSVSKTRTQRDMAAITAAIKSIKDCT